HYLVQLRRVHRHNLHRIHSSGEWHVEHARHVSNRTRRRAVRESDGPRSIPRSSVVVSYRPAAGTPDGVGGGDGNSSNVRDAQQAHLLAPCDEQHGDDSPNESAPEHQAGPAEESAHVAHQYRVVDLAAEYSADDGCEYKIRDR